LLPALLRYAVDTLRADAILSADADAAAAAHAARYFLSPFFAAAPMMLADYFRLR